MVNRSRMEIKMRSAEGTQERFQGPASSQQRVSPELAEFLHLLDNLEQHFADAANESAET